MIRQLALKFGPLPEDTIARIKTSSIRELDAIGEQLLSADSLEHALQLPH